MSANKLLPLVLSAKSTLTRMHDAEAESADSDFRSVRPSVLRRDQDACRFCGFADKGLYIQVHHLDDDHHNNKPENLVTACVHCHACFHIGLWGSRGEASIVYLPELEQWQLSHVCRALLVAKHYPSKLAQNREVDPARKAAAQKMHDAAKAMMARMEARGEQAEQLIGTSSAQDLANVLHNLPPEVYARRAERLKGLRLLVGFEHRPRDGQKDMLSDIAAGWMERSKDRKGPYSGLLPPDWQNLSALAGHRA